MTPRPVSFFRHDLGQPELDAVAEVLRGPILTTGATVAAFEERFARLLGAPFALGVTSCTGAMHMALAARGIGPGDEVITTPMTFVATATAILQAGATPVFVEVEENTGNLDATKVEAALTPRTKAILPVHLYGLMADMRGLRNLADRHRLTLVEDCAHCVEGRRDGVAPGELSDFACFSFYATKNMNSAEGGAITCHTAEDRETLKLLRLHGVTKSAADRHREGYSHWDMVSFGWKYNMDNLHAALLLPQFDRLAANLEKREALYQEYARLLGAIDGVTLPGMRDGALHARHLLPIRVPAEKRDGVIDALQKRGIGLAVNYRPVHLTTYFRETYGCTEGDFPVAERIGDETLSLPFYPLLTFDEVAIVSDAVAEAVASA